MDEMLILGLVVAVAAAVMAGLAFWRAGTAPGVTSLLEAMEEGLTDIETAAGAAREYVLAAEQLWETGRLDKDNRLIWVLERLQGAFPSIADETLIDSIEAAVAWMKLGEKKIAPSA